MNYNSDYYLESKLKDYNEGQCRFLTIKNNGKHKEFIDSQWNLETLKKNLGECDCCLYHYWASDGYDEDGRQYFNLKEWLEVEVDDNQFNNVEKYVK